MSEGKEILSVVQEATHRSGHHLGVTNAERNWQDNLNRYSEDRKPGRTKRLTNRQINRHRYERMLEGKFIMEGGEIQNKQLIGIFNILASGEGATSLEMLKVLRKNEIRTNRSNISAILSQISRRETGVFIQRVRKTNRSGYSYTLTEDGYRLTPGELNELYSPSKRLTLDCINEVIPALKLNYSSGAFSSGVSPIFKPLPEEVVEKEEVTGTIEPLEDFVVEKEVVIEETPSDIELPKEVVEDSEEEEIIAKPEATPSLTLEELEEILPSKELYLTPPEAQVVVEEELTVVAVPEQPAAAPVPAIPPELINLLQALIVQVAPQRVEEPKSEQHRIGIDVNVSFSFK